MDDIISTEDDEEEIDKCKSYLVREFKIKDMGSVKYFVGMEIATSKMDIAISQRKYLLNLLKETCMCGRKLANILMDYTTKLESKKVLQWIKELRKILKVCGELIYLTQETIYHFPVSVVCQLMNNPM